MKLEPKPWNFGPKRGTRTWRLMCKANGASNNALNTPHRVQKKVEARPDMLTHRFNGRRQRELVNHYRRELCRDAEENAYGRW